MSQRITLNSANTAVVISDSPAFKTQDESGFVFAGVNSLSYGFNNVRADTSQLGSQDSYDENIIRQPDVNLKMSYGFSPTFANEELMGLIYNLDAKSKFSITKGLTESSSNFYLYNHPEQEQDALEYIKNGAFPNGGEIVSIGNAYLTNYSMNFALGAFPTVDVEFDCSNIKIENYYSQLIESPAINLESGNNVGVGSMNILDTKYYEPSKFGGLYNLDRTKIETILPKDINFQMDNLTIGGQKLELENHRINQFSVTVPLQRSNSYRLGSDYVCSRKLNYPIKATLSISSLVTNLEAGFISGLVKGDQISNLRIISTDCQKKVTSQFYFEDIKLENVDYQTLVNEQTNYNLEFSFQITDEKGFKTAVTEQDIRDTRFIDDTNQVYEYIKGPVIANWQSGDLNGYKVAFGEVTDYGVFDRAFQDCVNIDKPVFLPEQINYFGNDIFNGCINLPDFYSDSTCQILSFGDRAFKDCSSLEKIVLPIRLEEVGEECFMGCSSATDLFLADVQSIGEKAFFNCSGLSESLYLPDSLSGLGESAFENCSGMEGGLYISKSLTRIEDKTFKNAKLLSFDLTIPDNVLSIGFEAFYGCEGFDGELILSSGLSGIEDYVFYGCNSLNGYLNIPGNVIEIGSSAFEGCSGFDKEVSFPGVEIIGANAFSGCSSLTGKLSFASGISTIGDNAFMGCDSLGYSLTIPSGIQSIGDRSFSGCSGIQDVYVNFPFNVFQGDEAFAGVRGCMYVTPFYYNGYKQNTVDGLYQGMPVCYGSLDTIVFDANTAETIKFKRGDIPSGWYSNQSRDSLLVIGSTCKNIEPGAFDGSNGLQGLFVVPDELESIGDFAFRGCSFEGELIIPDTIEYLGSGAFEDCSGFNDILLIGDGINEIKAKTFKNCSSINSDIILSPEIISIGDEAFYNCHSISGNLSLGISLSYIGDYAFYNCSSAIGDLEIPEDVTYVGDYAFYNCSSLDGEFISIEAAGLSYIGNYAFQDCSLMTGSLTMSASVSYIGSGAFKNCRGLDDEIDLTVTQINEINEESFFGCSGLIGLLVVPDSVQYIGDRAFLGCSSLTESITITNIAARNIGVNAFNSPIQFDELIISDSVREVSQYEFDYFKNDPLYLTMQEGLTVINEYSFSNYAFIGDLDMPLTLRYVGDAAFSGCEFGGTYIFEDSNIEYIGNYAFYDLDLINGNIDVPNVTYVGDGAFFNNSSIDGYITFGDVTSGVGEYAFANCSSAIGDLTLPNNIGYLGQFAFLNCSSLSGTLTLPNNEDFNIIKTGTFKNCSLLSGDLVIHDYISGIEQEAFLGCSSLTGDITITDVCASTLVGSNTFDDSPFSTLIISDSVVNVENGEFDYFSTRPIEVVFGKNLSGILDNAFDNYSFVSEVNLPSSLTGIGISAFQNCGGLYGPLTIPNNVSGIGTNAFRSCSNLSGNLIIPNRMTNIGDGAFVDCSSLDGYIRISDLTASAISSYTNVFGGTNFEELRATSSDLIIEDGEFDSFNAFVGALFLEPSVLDVGNYAFVDNFSFADTLTISENSEIIGDYAFSGNSFIGDLDVNSESVGYASFAECTSLDGEFTVNSATLSKVDDYAFYNCSNLSGNLFIGESLSGIGNYSFSNMSNLDGEFKLCDLSEDFEGLLSEYEYIEGESGSYTVEFEEFVTTSLKYFGDYAFANNSNLSGNLVIPDTTTSWGEYAFLNMSSLDGFLMLGSGVDSIPEGIFKNCSGLNCYDSLFKIPENVSLIGAEAFYNCSSLDCVLRLKPGITILTDAFFGTNFNGLLVPSGTVAILDGDYDAFQNAELRLIFEQPDSAFRTLGDLAFDNYKLTGNLLLPESTDYIGYSGFLNCDLLNGSFSVPLATETIGDGAFRNCSGFDGNFSLIDLPNSYNGESDLATALSEIGDYAFANCENWTGNLVILDGVNYGKYSFLNNKSLDGFLILNDTSEVIPEGAFKNCEQITRFENETFTIPRVVNTIGTEAFYNCQNLLNGDIKIGVAPIIGVDAFFSEDFDNLIVPDYEGFVRDGDYEYFKPLSIGLRFENYNSSSVGVTGISGKAFSGYNLTGTLNLPRRLQEVGDHAFINCTGLVGDLTFLSSLRTIGEGSFENCSGFDGNLFIGTSTKNIGNNAFANCNSLSGSIDIKNSCLTLGEEAFINCSGFDGGISIGNGIEYLEDRTFKNCESAAGSLELPNDITGIGNAVFANCFQLKSENFNLFEIPRVVDYIGDEAFFNCLGILIGTLRIKGGVDIGINSFEPFNFEKISVPDYYNRIGSGDYSYFKDKIFELDFENYNVISTQKTQYIDEKAFSGYNLTGGLNLPIRLREVGDSAFVNSTGLSGGLYLYQYLETIGERAFENCSGFEGEFSLAPLPSWFAGTSNFGATVQLEDIGDYAFANCKNWTGNLVIPDGVSYGEYSFLNNSSLNGFLILNETTSVIPEGAFKDCSQLTCYDGVFKIPQAVNLISTYAFQGCSGLDCDLQIGPDASIGTQAFEGTDFKGLVVPKFVQEVQYQDYDYFKQDIINLKFEDYNSSSNTRSIGSGAFADYNFSGELNLPISLTGIGDNAFYQNDLLEGPLNIPSNVRGIGSGAFENCSGFYGDFSFPASIVDIGAKAFKNCKNLIGTPEFFVTTETIGDEAFANCLTLIGEIELPANITSIGSGAFINAVGLSGVLITALSPAVFKGENAFSGVQGIMQLSPLIYQAYQTDSRTIEINGEYYFQGIQISGQVADDTVFYISPDEQESNKYEDPFNGRLTSQNFQDYAIPNNWKEGLTSDPNSNNINTQLQNCWLDIGGLCNSVTVEAFKNRKNLRGEVFFPGSVDSIDESAFENCTSLQELTFDSLGLRDIEDRTFYNCSNVSSNIDLPETVRSIKTEAFRHMFKAGDLTLRGTSLTGISGNTFHSFGNKALNKTFKLNEGLLNVETYGFYQAGGTGASLELPSTLETIGYQAFYSFGEGSNLLAMGELKGINESSNLTSIANSTFEYSKLTGNLVFPSSLTHIPDYAFYGSMITSISGLENLDYIGRSAFARDYRYATNLTMDELIIPEGPDLHYQCFSNHRYIKKVVIEGHKPIEGLCPPGGGRRGGHFGATLRQNILNSIEVSGVEVFPYYMFGRCDKMVLKNDTFGENCSGFEGSSFSYAQYDTLIYTNVKNGNGDFGKINLPSGVKLIGSSAFENNSMIDELNFSGASSGLCIDDSAFNNCGNYDINFVNNEPGPRSIYTSQRLDPEVNITGQFLIPSGLEFLGNSSFKDIRGRNLDIIFSDDFVESQIITSYINSQGATQFRNDTLGRMNNAFQKAQLNKLHLSQSMRKMADNILEECVIMDHNNFDSPLGVEEFGTRSCYLFNCESGDGKFTFEFGSGLNRLGSLSFATAGIPEDPTFAGKLIPNHTYFGVYKEHRCIEEFDFSRVSGAVDFEQSCFRRTWADGTMTLPEVNSLGDGVFFGANRLKEIIFTSSPNLTNLADETFSNLANLSGVVFNDELTSIGNSCFENCPSLLEFDIQSTQIESLGNEVFKDCVNLTDIKLCNGSITTLGDNLFENCTSIDNLYICNTITTVGSNLFLNANINELWYDVNTNVLDAFLFNGATIGDLRLPLTTIVVKEGVFQNAIFGPDPFGGLPNTVVTFEDSVFYQTPLSGIIIPTSLSGLANTTFKDSPNLTGLNFSLCSSLTGIGNENFMNCDSISGIVLPNSLQIIGDSNFKDSNLIEEVIFPTSLEYIGDENFKNCSGIAFVDLSNSSLIEMGSRNFIEDTNTKTIFAMNLPDSLQIIGDENFKEITLNTLKLPTGLKVLGDSNFYDCQGSTLAPWDEGDPPYFVLPSGIESIGNSNWEKSDAIQKLKIEEGFSGSIGDFNWSLCNQISEIQIKTQDSNFSIGSSNFVNLNLLLSVQIDCPASCWQGLNNFELSRSNMVIYVNSDYAAGYDATWSGDQALPDGATILSYTPTT